MDLRRPITEHRARTVTAPAEVVWDAVTSLGGPAGWGAWDPAWRLRGRVDRVLGGPGMRGRPHQLRVGAAVDLWRVEELMPGESIVLRTEARMPGTASMRLAVRPVGAEQSVLTQDVLFEPGGPLGIPGRAMWFAELPGHKLVFSGMVRDLAREAERRHAEGGSPRRGAS